MKEKNILKIKKKRDHFFIIDNIYVKLYAKHLGVAATAVFTSLNMHADADGKCFPSMELMAEQHGIDRHTVSRALKKLENWNIISIGRAIDRKLKKRKNNSYELQPKELWKKPAENVDNNNQDSYDDVEVDEDNFWGWNDFEENETKNSNSNNHEESHGIINATQMALEIPYNGTEDTSNKTHIIRTMKENPLCGQEPTKTSEEPSLFFSSGSSVWNSENAILGLIKSSYKDYQIIGSYFYVQQYSFRNKMAYEKAVERSLRAAKALKEYTIDDIRKTMKWLDDKDFDTGWSLEAVNRYIDDCISTGFILDGEERTEQLNIINA